MQMRRTSLIAAVAVLAMAMSTACVSKKIYRADVEETDQRVSGVESAVEANERRISDLSDDTDKKIESVRGTAEKAVEIGSNALDRAEAAEQAAERAGRAVAASGPTST